MSILEKSIKKNGVLVPIAVEKKGENYLIIDGERRYRASKTLGLKEIPCIIYDEMDDVERLVKRFHLQEHQSQWSAFDKARAIASFSIETKMSTKDIAELLGIARGTIQGYISLLSLSKRTQIMANEHKIPYSYLRSIAHISGNVENRKLATRLEENLLEKVKNKVVVRQSDMVRYNDAIKSRGVKAIRYILSHKDVTGQEVLKKTGGQDFYFKRKTLVNAGFLITCLRRVAETRGTFTETQKATLEKTIAEIKKHL